MNLWTIEPANSSFAVYLDDTQVLDQLRGPGREILPETIRSALASAGESSPTFYLLKLDQNTFEIKPSEVYDFGIWRTSRVFSDRAMHSAVTLGCDSNDFFQFRINVCKQDLFYIYLPNTIYDVIDESRSSFRIDIPGPPRILSGIEKLGLRSGQFSLPPIFKVRFPSNELIFSDVIVTDSYRQHWITSRFRGADFRKLT